MFGQHIRYVKKKTEGRLAKLSRIITNIRKPVSRNKQKMLYP